uniref:Cytidylate kinase-like family protein n=1 Tax=Myoviridae sp. ctOv05 TaxID=2825094 RepID=A0A8S5P504_9CAUD|nr:MAG TPA: Cytidylate kinase-like family protein [Myoviridae sp. ctOv05]
MKRIITISRQFGSGGRTIAKQLGEKLDIPCYDNEFLMESAKQSGFSENYIKNESEYAQGGFLAATFYSKETSLTNQDKLWIIQRNIILDLAEKGSCIIVGRCADFILRDKAKCLNVFIHASMEKRAERIIHVYGEREESPEQRLKDKDKRRASYYRFYTDTKWGEAKNYHVALDSGELGIPYCVDVLAGITEKFFNTEQGGVQA